MTIICRTLFAIPLFLLCSGGALDASTKTAKKVLLVAIIDTGIDTEHRYFQTHLWGNPGESGFDSQGRERSKNGIDDDGNGFIDDFRGWDFAANSPVVFDNHGHGTHIAGVIKQSVMEKKPNSAFKFMALKYYEASPRGKRRTQRAFLEALRYAIAMKADIINISGGGYKRSPEEFQLLKKAQTEGIVIVAAAGNKKLQKISDRNFYPAAYKLPHIYSVVATDRNGNRLASSNLNIHKKNYFTPGRKIYSALPGNKFGYKTGSSQAAAVFTGDLIARHKL